jgi:dual specificity MAP kinase phosphatase
MPGILTEVSRLAQQLRHHGVILTFWAGVDKLIRWTTGGPSARFSRITDEIWLGGQPSQEGWEILRSLGVTGVVNMRSEYNYEHIFDFGSIRYLHLPTTDNEAPTLEHLSAGVDFIRKEVGGDSKVYIHCWEGLGRGPTMAAAYFVSLGMTPIEAWRQIRLVRPFVRPTELQLERLEQFARDYQPNETLSKIEAQEAEG